MKTKATLWMTSREFEAILLQLGFTWTAAAERLDLSFQQIYRLRRGQSPVPRQTAELLRLWVQHGVPEA